MQKRTELTELVNESDVVIGCEPRWRADESPSRKRSARVIILDPEMNIWVHWRALTKQRYRRMPDTGIAETLFANESYPHGGKRGVWEEAFNCRPDLPFERIALENLACPWNFYDPAYPRIYWLSVFHYNPAIHGPITHQPEEIMRSGFYGAPALEELLAREQFTPAGRKVGEIAIGFVKGIGAASPEL